MANNKDGSKRVFETKTVRIWTVTEIISIYPNPASTQFNVVLSQTTDKEVLITIKNVVGKTIVSRNIPIVAGQRTYPFNINKIESGTYLVEVISSNYCKALKLVIR